MPKFHTEMDVMRKVNKIRKQYGVGIILRWDSSRADYGYVEITEPGGELPMFMAEGLPNVLLDRLQNADALLTIAFRVASNLLSKRTYP